MRKLRTDVIRPNPIKMDICVYDVSGVGVLLGRAYCMEGLRALAHLTMQRTGGGSFHGEFYGVQISGEMTEDEVMDWANRIYQDNTD